MTQYAGWDFKIKKKTEKWMENEGTGPAMVGGWAGLGCENSGDLPCIPSQEHSNLPSQSESMPSRGRILCSSTRSRSRSYHRLPVLQEMLCLADWRTHIFVGGGSVGVDLKGPHFLLFQLRPFPGLLFVTGCRFQPVFFFNDLFTRKPGFERRRPAKRCGFPKLVLANRSLPPPPPPPTNKSL